jgi:uncharacterized membrane protein
LKGEVYVIIEEYLSLIIPYISSTLEAVGVFIISLAAIKGCYLFVKAGFDFGDETVAVELAKAMSLSLSFKLAAEILKTVTVHTMDEFKMLAAVAILRVVLTLVLYWEIKVATHSEDLKEKEKEKLEAKP